MLIISGEFKYLSQSLLYGILSINSFILSMAIEKAKPATKHKRTLKLSKKLMLYHYLCQSNLNYLKLKCPVGLDQNTSKLCIYQVSYLTLKNIHLINFLKVSLMHCNSRENRRVRNRILQFFRSIIAKPNSHAQRIYNIR